MRPQTKLLSEVDVLSSALRYRCAVNIHKMACARAVSFRIIPPPRQVHNENKISCLNFTGIITKRRRCHAAKKYGRGVVTDIRAQTSPGGGGGKTKRVAEDISVRAAPVSASFCRRNEKLKGAFMLTARPNPSTRSRRRIQSR